MKITVIVPFYNAAPYLVDFIKAITSQSLAAEHFDVVFVNNDSSDGSEAQLVRLLADNTQLNARQINYQQRASSYGARNKGVRESSGDILVFTDIDCLVERDWLQQIHEIFSQEHIDVISGFVDLVIDDKNNPWQWYDKTFHMDNQANAEKGHIVTANLAVRRDVFQQIGDFEEVESGGDFDWSQRMNRLGKRFQFKSQVKVSHPTRKSADEIRKKLNRLVRGDAELAVKSLNAAIVKITKAVLRPLKPSFYIKINGFLSKTNLVGKQRRRFMAQVVWLKLIQLGQFIRFFIKYLRGKG
ncbi:glycosyltransferase family A protein [Thalassotalea sp. Y01]|uniref:glycosyltransferase n=1 Tax=Thalassotalea sp. Y01 TaxID=2729613 RepID=UPI00145DADB5|nr:glycosyltransferase family A protein [Thalassotalea sp. Y01]NMP14780.1 glycosyltransferase family 2 protein [Thalassotalea sp. Y01]